MRVLMWLLALAVILGSFTSTGVTGSMPTIRYIDYKVYDPVYLARDLGLFTKHGVNVVSVGENLSAVDELVAISGGAADMVTASIPALLNAKAAGLDVIGVADMQSVLPEQPLLEFYVREDSSIRTVADARGKTWAVNNFKAIFHYMALTALAKAGVPEDTVRFTRLFFTEQIVALEKGQVDIIGVPEPFASFVRNNYAGKFRRLTTVLDIAGPKQLVLYTTNSRVDKDAVQRFIAATWPERSWRSGLALTPRTS